MEKEPLVVKRKESGDSTGDDSIQFWQISLNFGKSEKSFIV